MSSDHDVVVTGIGATTPIGGTAPETWQAMLAGRSGIGPITLFDPEPFPVDSPIRDLPNVFLTPHIAGVNAAGGPRFFRIMVDELERFFGGHETRYDLLPRTIANRTGAAPPRRV